MSVLIAISGGIGSGKSVVCNILAASGFSVYNCDDQAKRIMDTSPDIWQQLCTDIHPKAVENGVVNRPLISSIVFNDPERLKALNAIVHKAVEEDILKWAQENSSQPVLFVETAILYQSGLDKLVDANWEVTAPDEIRIARVMKRNSLAREAVEARMKAQQHPVPVNPVPTVEIVNDNVTPILPQIEANLANLDCCK